MRKLWNGGSGIKQQPSSKEESRTQMVEEGKKNTLACMQLHTNELNRFSYTWAHELNERKTIIFKRSTSCSPTFNVKMCFFFVDFFSPICSSVQILCSHFLFHSAVWVLHTLFTMLFLCFNNENYVKKTEHAYTPGKRERESKSERTGSNVRRKLNHNLNRNEANEKESNEYKMCYFLRSLQNHMQRIVIGNK